MTIVSAAKTMLATFSTVHYTPLLHRRQTTDYSLLILVYALLDQPRFNELPCATYQHLLSLKK